MKRVMIASVAALTVAGCGDDGHSDKYYTDLAKASEQAAQVPVPPPEDVMPTSTAEYLGLFEARGLHLGMHKADVAPALATRGMFVPPEGGAPLTEMVAQLPTFAASETAYIDTPECRDEFQRHRNMSASEANSLAATFYRGCDMGARIFYDSEQLVVAFYVTPAGFGLERTDLRQFAEAVAANLPTGDLVPETQSIRTLGQSGVCTNFVGQATAGERISVSDCGFMRMQVQHSAAASGDFQ